MAEEDILFGKHRHLFGGVAPSNMLAFDVTFDYELYAARIRAILPEDTVIDGQTVCSVKGAVIRRKTTGYPKDEFDGELVMTIYESGSFIDLGAFDDAVPYYYAAFPFSTQDVYNRNEANWAVINDIPTLEDSQRWFTTTGLSGGRLHTRMFMYNVIKGGTVADTLDDYWNYVTIRRRIDRYPINENDGDAVAVDYEWDASTFENFYDYNVKEGEKYFYAIFPCRVNADGTKTYSYNVKNRYSIIARPYTYRFGYDLDTNDPNPNTRVTYPSDVDNAFFKPAKMDYSGGSFDYGDWPSEAGAMASSNFMPTPVVLKADGNATGNKPDPNDYAKDIDGNDNTANIQDTAGKGYNVMMQWPKIYTKRELTSDGIYKFRCSDYKIDDSYECWCNYDKNGNEVDNFYTAVYPACETTGPKLRSLSGQQMKTGSYAQYQMDYADNNGDGWFIEYIADRLLIQDLLVLMAKTTNCQKAYGKGICGEKATVATTGTMDKRGLFWGSEDPSEGVKVFGMEHWWGNKRRRVAGLVSVDGKYKVKVTRSTKDGSTATDFNYDGSGYLDPNCSFNCVTSNSSEYISDMKVTDYGRLPINGGGTSSRHEADTVTTIPSGTRFANCGGAHTSQEGYVGPFTLELTDPNGTSTTNDICVAISYKG